VPLVKRIGVSTRTFGGLRETPDIPEGLEDVLWQAYCDDVANLEELRGRSIDFWGPEKRKAAS
jgi:hypothetical protein